MIEPGFQIGELVWFTFEGAVPRLGMISATMSSGYCRILFGKEEYWISEEHIAKYTE